MLKTKLNRREKPLQFSKAIAVRDTANYVTKKVVSCSKTKYYKVRRGDNLRRNCR